MARKAAKSSASKRRGVKARARKQRRAVGPRPGLDWAVRDLNGPVPGPVSVGQRKELIGQAIEAVRVGTRRGRRSTMWQHFSEQTIFECMMRIIVGGEPAQAVARHVCGVDDPEADTEAEAKAKLLQGLLATLRREYLRLHDEHRKGAEFARAMDETGDDLDAQFRKINVKLAMVIDKLLLKAAVGELTTAEQHLLARNIDILNHARERQAKADKDDAATERVKKLTSADLDGKNGSKKFSPDDLRVLFDSLADGDSNDQAMRRVRDDRRKREAV